MKINPFVKLKFGVASVAALALALIFVVAPTPAAATVGGPTYISQLATDEGSVNLYYIVNDNGGRGCPPIIHKTTIANGNDVEVKTCNEIEATSGSSYSAYNAFVADTYADLHYLSSVSLAKNHITIRIEKTGENLDGEYRLWTDFRATISQDGKELAKIPFRGCSPDQPHVFEGYMIPSTGVVASDAMALLISNKGDCFEGGYVRENLHIVKGVKYLDTTPVRTFKRAEATEPNTGNAVVYVGATGGVDVNEPPPGVFTDTPMMREILALLAVLIVGVVVGFLVGKRRG